MVMSVQLPSLPDRLENEEALRIFRELSRSPEMTQREFSSRLGISLGKVNFLINALIRRGFVKVENFKKSSNKSKYLYYLTPRGIEEKSRMTYLFLKRKTREYEQLELEIRQLREEMRESGIDSEEQVEGGKGL
jgi:EPS-associated MarR family transcriptional regulator